MSSAQLKALLGSGGETEDEDKCQNKLMALFSQHDDYDERKSRNFMERLHNKNIEVGIKLKAWKTMKQMDIFEAFGAPGHLGVHAGLTFAYKGLADWFISVSVDLAAIPAKLIENEEIQLMILEHYFKKLISMPNVHVIACISDLFNESKARNKLLEANKEVFKLFDIFKKLSLKEDLPTTLENNCITYKTSILTDNIDYMKRYSHITHEFEKNWKSPLKCLCFVRRLSNDSCWSIRNSI